MSQHPQKQLATIRPFNLPARLWTYLLEKTLGERAQYRWQHLTQKDLNRLTNSLCNDSYQIAGRAAFKDEFVTCGGVSLAAVDANTLENKNLPRVFFAGEVLDIDGVTGGFNFQAAWTTAYVVAIIQLRSDKGFQAVERLQVARRGIGSFQLDTIGIREYHQNGGHP